MSHFFVCLFVFFFGNPRETTRNNARLVGFPRACSPSSLSRNTVFFCSLYLFLFSYTSRLYTSTMSPGFCCYIEKKSHAANWKMSRRHRDAGAWEKPDQKRREKREISYTLCDVFYRRSMGIISWETCCLFRINSARNRCPEAFFPHSNCQIVRFRCKYNKKNYQIVTLSIRQVEKGDTMRNPTLFSQSTVRHLYIFIRKK